MKYIIWLFGLNFLLFYWMDACLEMSLGPLGYTVLITLVNELVVYWLQFFFESSANALFHGAWVTGVLPCVL